LAALASGFVVLAVGTGVAVYMGDRIQSSALSNARQNAQYIARLGFAPRLGRIGTGHPLSLPTRRALARLAGSGFGKALAGVQVVDARGRVAWSSAAGATPYGPLPGSAAALRGRLSETVTSVPDATGGSRRVLAIAVPLSPVRGARTPGAVVVMFDYAPIAARIAHASREVDLALLLGLALIYAVLFLNSASAKLRTQAETLRRHAQETEYMAQHDGLTGLPNRILLRDRAHQAILFQARRRGRMALLVMDVDGFKEVNDTLGHNGGDQLLREIAVRIRATLREGDSAARLGGDEFAVMLPEVTDAEATVEVAERIRTSLRRPFIIQSVTVSVDTSIGIGVYPDHGIDYEQLLQRADVAMYAAKKRRTGHQLHDVDVETAHRAQLGLASDLHEAIAQGALGLHYQPQVSLTDGRVVAVEALARWTHPKHGNVPPDVFIPLAERSGAIRALTLRVLNDALAQVRSLRDAGFEVPVAVNLSTRDLLDMQLPAEVGAALAAAGLDSSRLEVEITESVIMADPDRAHAVLAELRRMGVRVTIDDFGSGYSSLAYLKRLAVDQLKIDKAFVLSMHEDPNDAVIVQSTIELAHNLGLTVVAEGVETPAVQQRLAGLGCDVAQGYHVCPPVPAGALAHWLRRRRDDALLRTA
jgi:diguanylate cyclase (GGDEF)-like protein